MSISNVLAGLQPWHIENGHVLELIRKVPTGSVKLALSSPPYWRQRTYTDGNSAELGQERTLAEFVANLVAVFTEVRRASTDDAVALINLGDCWNGTGRAGGDYRPGCKREGQRPPPGRFDPAMKRKDLALTPAAVAQALRDSGWYLRQEIIWDKGWASPGSAQDRPVTTHETIWLLGASARYTTYGASKFGTVWQFPPNRGAVGHHAAMPIELAARCIEIGSQPGDLVFDPFSGTGTTGVAAVPMGRRYLGFELSEEFAEASRRRIAEALEPNGQLGLFAGSAS